MKRLQPLWRVFPLVHLLLALACGWHRESSATPAVPTPTGILPAPACPGTASGQVVLYAAEDDIWRVRVDGTLPERLTEGGILQRDGYRLSEVVNYWPPRVSPDGCWIACCNGTHLLVASVPAGTQRLVGEPYPGLYDWAPDSSALAFWTGTPPPERQVDIRIYDPWRDVLETRVTLGGERPKVGHLVWSPDGRYLAFSCCFKPVEPYTETATSIGQVRRLDVGTRQVETVGTIEIHVAAGSRLCWTDSGEIIASPQRPHPRQAVRCWPAPYGSSPLASPDGRQRMELGRLLEDQTGTRLASFPTGSGTNAGPLWQRDFPDLTLWRVLWSPDGQYLLLDDDEAHSPIWRLRAEGTGDLEQIVADGFLVETVAAWQ